jgi:class 3 adenylate cyclase/tetratricopeptide (TPR) repeat protein
MQCPRCQHQNEAGAKFCEECAVPLARVCSGCGRPLSPTAKFCPECAQPTGLPAAPPPAQRFGAPESYTPKHLAEKILTSRSALEGERKQVTVLFADLKGSMELLADRDPEEARKLLDPVLERMMDAVHRYEGTVNQVMGDGIMALFGAPVAHEDHAVRACYAALDMQAAIGRYAEEVRRAHGLNPQIRVGLNSGEVVVRAIGSDLHMDYTAVGQTTHLAARMEQFATPGTIALTADTLGLAEGYIEVKPLGPVPVKGLEAPVDVYEMLGAGPRRSRLHAAAARGLTRFVGRDHELEQLRHALSRAASGHGQIVAIVGEPGVGKSRLVWEVTHSHRTHGWLILQGSSVSYGKATPYLPVIDLLKGYFKVQGQDDHREIREKVTGKLLTLDRVLEPTLPAFLSLLDVPVEDREWEMLDPGLRRQRTLEAVKRLLLRESRVQPLLAVFEDLHWIDSETQTLLDSLAESAPTARLLLLVNYRPEYEHRWGSKTYYTQLRLDPLPPESAGELLRALLADDPALTPVMQLLIDRTEGNPFFLEESVRTLVETGILVGERGAYRVARPVETVQVPATVQAVLAARIDRLPGEEKRLLQCASVIGKDLSAALLQAIVEMAAPEVRRGLAHLQTAEFVYETQLFPDAEYTFKHALTHEVAYGSLLQDRRRALHTRIIEAMERLYADRLAEHVERLAYHASRGEAWEKGVTYSHQAGAKVYARSAAPEAIAHFEQALVALSHLPETRATLEKAIDLRIEIRTPLAQLVEYERTLAHLREAERLAEKIGDRRRLGHVLGLMTFSLQQLAGLAAAVKCGRRALEIATEERDARLEETASFFLARALHGAGDLRRALELYERAFAASGPAEGVMVTYAGHRPAVLRGWGAVCLADLGRFEDAIAWSREAVAIADAMAEPFSRVAARYTTGIVWLQRGDLPQATAALADGLALCRESNVGMYHHSLLSALGEAYALAGRLGEAVPLMEEAVGLCRARRLRAWVAPILRRFGEVALLGGRHGEGRAAAEEALTVAREYGERSHEAGALRLLGEVAEDRDPPNAPGAEARYREALSLAEELGMRPLVAHCHLGLGKLYYRTGDRAKAEQHLTAAAAMYREMGMGFWLEKAEAEFRGPA